MRVWRSDHGVCAKLVVSPGKPDGLAAALGQQGLGRRPGAVRAVDGGVLNLEALEFEGVRLTDMSALCVTQDFEAVQNRPSGGG
jgi:hypothetical protein